MNSLERKRLQDEFIYDAGREAVQNQKTRKQYGGILSISILSAVCGSLLDEMKDGRLEVSQ